MWTGTSQGTWPGQLSTHRTTTAGSSWWPVGSPAPPLRLWRGGDSDGVRWEDHAADCDHPPMLPPTTVTRTRSHRIQAFIVESIKFQCHHIHEPLQEFAYDFQMAKVKAEGWLQLRGQHGKTLSRRKASRGLGTVISVFTTTKGEGCGALSSSRTCVHVSQRM